MTAAHIGFPINGPHTIAQRLVVRDAKTESGRLLASYRHGPYGWYVSVDGKPCEIYLATEDEAQTCLAAVEKALR